MAAKNIGKSGFKVKTLSEGTNPVYSIKYTDNEHPVICFLKPMTTNLIRKLSLQRF
jgi:arsenate reductase